MAAYELTQDVCINGNLMPSGTVVGLNAVSDVDSSVFKGMKSTVKVPATTLAIHGDGKVRLINK